MRTSWKEWFGLLFSLLLSAAGALMVLSPRKPSDLLTGWTCLLFFALASLTFLHTLWERYQGRSFLNADQVTLAPGARFDMKQGRFIFLGAAVALLGTLAILNARQESSGILTACGALFLLGGPVFLLMGLWGSQYLLFEPSGLRIGNRGGSLLITWENLAGLEVGEYHGNPVLYFWFKDLEALARTSRGSSNRWSAGKILKSVQRSREWAGCDWMLFTWHYGLNAVLLAKAILTYVADPTVRESLKKHLELGERK